MNRQSLMQELEVYISTFANLKVDNFLKFDNIARMTIDLAGISAYGEFNVEYEDEDVNQTKKKLTYLVHDTLGFVLANIPYDEFKMLYGDMIASFRTYETISSNNIISDDNNDVF